MEICIIPNLTVPDAILLRELYVAEKLTFRMSLHGSDKNAFALLEGPEWSVKWLVYLFGREQKRIEEGIPYLIRAINSRKR